MLNLVQKHYEDYPYPNYPLIASVRQCDTYALNLTALWAHFNGVLPPLESKKILIAGCGTFSPYPFSIANPDIPITALDLSKKSLRRASWHALIHLRQNITYQCADLADPSAIDGKYGFIDSFGVLHHLEDPLRGLKILEQHLVPGGILRIMLYSRYARREEESIRRSFRLLGVDSPDKARRLLSKALHGSRLSNYLALADEPKTISGLADALLHPCVHTYRIDELLEMIESTNLEILKFAHFGACEKPSDEIKRLKTVEKGRQSGGNFILYLGKNIPCITNLGSHSESIIMLNPCLKSSVASFKFLKLEINSKFGVENPPITFSDRQFLRKFVDGVNRKFLSIDDLNRVEVYKRNLFLVEYRKY